MEIVIERDGLELQTDSMKIKTGHNPGFSSEGTRKVAYAGSVNLIR